LDVDRRRFLTASLGLAGGSALLTGCGKQNKAGGEIAGEKPQKSASEPVDNDVSDVVVLNSALDLEHRAVAAYTAAIGALSGPNLRTAREFRDHERAHVLALTRAIKSMGGTPNQAAGHYTFPRLPSQNAVLRFAIDLEDTAVAAYIDAIPRLNTADLRAETAAIVATEAEHLAVLSGALAQRSSPTAFVTGLPAGQAVGA
jgi:rubrerythrin